MCIIKMFAEHISLKFTENEIVISAKRLWMVNIQLYVSLNQVHIPAAVAGVSSFSETILV